MSVRGWGRTKELEYSRKTGRGLLEGEAVLHHQFIEVEHLIAFTSWDSRRGLNIHLGFFWTSLGYILLLLLDSCLASFYVNFLLWIFG